MLGSEQLRAWIDRRCESDREASRLLGLDHTYLSQILNGHRTPGLANSIKIERVTGIPVEAWVPTDDGKSDPVGVSPSAKRRRSKA